MLSTQAIKNTGQASHYFLGRDDYYTEGGTFSQERSQWWGKGVQILRLSGAIDPIVFTELLKDKLLDGQQLSRQEGDQIKHRLDSI